MNRYEQGWRESRDERFERKLRRLALVTVLSAVALVATGVTRGAFAECHPRSRATPGGSDSHTKPVIRSLT